MKNILDFNEFINEANKGGSNEEFRKFADAYKKLTDDADKYRKSDLSAGIENAKKYWNRLPDDAKLALFGGVFYAGAVSSIMAFNIRHFKNAKYYVSIKYPNIKRGSNPYNNKVKYYYNNYSYSELSKMVKELKNEKYISF